MYIEYVYTYIHTYISIHIHMYTVYLYTIYIKFMYIYTYLSNYLCHQKMEQIFIKCTAHTIGNGAFCTGRGELITCHCSFDAIQGGIFSQNTGLFPQSIGLLLETWGLFISEVGVPLDMMFLSSSISLYSSNTGLFPQNIGWRLGLFSYQRWDIPRTRGSCHGVYVFIHRIQGSFHRIQVGSQGSFRTRCELSAILRSKRPSVS